MRLPRAVMSTRSRFVVGPPTVPVSVRPDQDEPRNMTTGSPGSFVTRPEAGLGVQDAQRSPNWWKRTFVGTPAADASPGRVAVQVKRMYAFDALNCPDPRTQR